MGVELSPKFPSPLQCLFVPKRYKVLYGGRGAGRSWGVARALLLMGANAPIRVLCVRELQNSIEESVHKLLSDQIDDLGLSAFYKIEKAKIYGLNGTTFSFEGIKNNTTKIKSYEGIDYCWVEEANKVSKNSWKILAPTVRRDGSEIWMTFNPELDTDYTYVRYAKEPNLEPPLPGRFPEPIKCPIFESPSTFSVFMTWRDNPWFPEELRKEMKYDKEHDYDSYLNVWEGHTVQALQGAVYAKELRQATLQHRICSVPYEAETPVDVFFDLGRADNTAMWFAQRVGMQWRLLRYYENSSFKIPMDDPSGGINHFLKQIQNTSYIIGTVWLPHDARHKRLGMQHSIEQIVRKVFPSTRIVPNLSVADGINAARMIFSNCWFDEEECEEGLHALRHYRYKIKDGQVASAPLHDSASDGADAFRYFAVASSAPRERQKVALIHRLLKPKSSVYVESAPHLGWMR